MNGRTNDECTWPALRWSPPTTTAVPLQRNGYALLSDLTTRSYVEVIRAMEAFQAMFLAQTRALWDAEFPIPGDSLSHFSRQWEYPYTWANLEDMSPSRILDAGSGITFFPFLLASAGHSVTCCDNADDVDLPPKFAQAVASTGCDIDFAAASLAALPFADRTFDAAVCLSVLEHTGSDRSLIIDELARVVRPGGRLVVTIDVSLRHDTAMLVEDVGVLMERLSRWFCPLAPLDLQRPPDLLSSDAYLTASSWRLPPPWQPPSGMAAPSNGEFRSIAVLGLTMRRREVG